MKTASGTFLKQRYCNTLLSGCKRIRMSRTLLLMLCITFVLLFMLYSCKKESDAPEMHYYEVGVKGDAAEWRDSSFIIATSDKNLVAQIETQLLLPVAQRQIVNGQLVAGNGEYNKNASHQFKWHFNENDWDLADFSIEIYDGRPYSDLDLDTDYWLNTVKRFAPWGSYIKKEISNP